MSLDHVRLRKKLANPPNHYPRFLYKYKNIEPLSHIRDIIVESRLWYSKPSDFNDPFDTKINMSVSGSHADIIRRIKKALKRTTNPRVKNSALEEQAARLYAGLRDKKADLRKLAYKSHETTMGTCGIICFSEDPRSILLWSHYGHRHTGICFQFEVASDQNFWRALASKYMTNYPAHDWVKDDDRKLLDGIYTKFDGWRYEKEHRIVMANAAGQYLSFAPSALKGVILGCNISKDSAGKIMQLVNERKQKSLPPIKIYQAAQSNNSYTLRINR